MKNHKKVCVIACKIIKPDLERAAKKLGLDVDFEFLHFGLHNTPTKLGSEVQVVIDKVSASGKYSRIVLGYGICGKGTNGIKAVDVPMIIPQVHDCITFFLGSRAAYKEQFEKCPGTYYFTKGWFDENPNYETTLRIGLNVETPGKTYTQDELKILEEFLAGWQKNYSRAVFVRDSLDADDDNYRQIAKKMAVGYGWSYEEILGSGELFEKMLVAEKSDADILVIEPGQSIVFNETEGRLEIIKDNC
jgi:hypothetical protein